MIRIAGIQLYSQIGKTEDNVSKAISFVEKAIMEKANLICLPEMFNTGYFSHTSHADPFGKLIKLMGREEGILLSDIDLNQIENARMKRFLYRDRRPELYAELVKMDQ